MEKLEPVKKTIFSHGILVRIKDPDLYSAIVAIGADKAGPGLARILDFYKDSIIKAAKDIRPRPKKGGSA